MNVHKNARLTPAGRALLARRMSEGWTAQAAADAAGVSLRTARKWLGRHRRGGERRYDDRSSAPRRCPRKVSERHVAEIEQLRRRRMTGPAIAQALGMARSTVGAILRRLGLGRLAALEPKPAIVRYERAAPGEMIHLDIKKLGRFDIAGHRATGDRRKGASRGAGWDFLHVCVDDASRLPTPRSCLRKASSTPPPSWSGRWPGSTVTASASSG
jgi:transposase